MPDTTFPAVDIAAPTETSPRLHRTVEDQAIEKYIVDSGKILEAARSHTTIVERLDSHGFDDEELSIGMAMQAEALRSFRARHGDSVPERSPAMDALTERVEKARDDFEAYRLIARAVFPTIPDRITLCATADALEDLQRFINAAHAGYVAASKEPYTEKMSKRGYPPARLETLLREIDVLATLDTAHAVAAADGTADDGSEAADTEERDRTYLELKTFMKELKGVCQALFRKNPETLAVLGL